MIALERPSLEEQVFMTKQAQRIYGGKDPRQVPLYTAAEAARYLHMPAPTVRSWVYGREYPKAGGKARFSPIVQRPEPDDQRLSFKNLVEAAALRTLRSQFRIDMKAVRAALNHARDRYDVADLLASRDLYAAPGEIFLERYGQLINLNRASQLAMKTIMASLLQRIEWEKKSAVRFFPVLPYSEFHAEKPIVIDPRVSFGRPVLASRSISTAAIADRINAGEEIAEVAADYDVTEDEIKDALAYERAA